MKKQHVQLSKVDREYLETLISKGNLAVRIYKRALGLLELGRGKSYRAVAETVGVDQNTMREWCDKYQKSGVEFLTDQPRPGRPLEIDGLQRAKITALACSEAPEGYARWHLRLLAEKAIELEYCESISHTMVSQILKKNELQPHLKRIWCLGKIDSHFLAQMERILWLYGLPYDPLYPVVCFAGDLRARPCFLIGDKVEPQAMQSGQVRKEHSADEKHGSCALLAAIEPLTGKRLAQVHPRRTKRVFTHFCKALAATYPDAGCPKGAIRLVLDNLNTHNSSAFDENLPADQAFALAQRFAFFYTPKAASWLNMIEIEFSALARLCLDRRIPTLAKLESDVLALVKARHDKQIKIHWQFSLQAARNKFNKHYKKLLPENEKLKIT